MTVGNLKRLLEGVDENKIVVFKDSMNGWCNLQDSIDTTFDYVVLLEDCNIPFSDYITPDEFEYYEDEDVKKIQERQQGGMKNETL